MAQVEIQFSTAHLLAPGSLFLQGRGGESGRPYIPNMMTPADQRSMLAL